MKMREMQEVCGGNNLEFPCRIQPQPLDLLANRRCIQNFPRLNGQKRCHEHCQITSHEDNGIYQHVTSKPRISSSRSLTFGRSIVVMMPIPTPEGRVRDGRIARRRGVQADHAVEVIADDAVEQRRWCRRRHGGWVVVGHRGKNFCDDRLRWVLDRMVSPVIMIRGVEADQQANLTLQATCKRDDAKQ